MLANKLALATIRQQRSRDPSLQPNHRAPLHAAQSYCVRTHHYCDMSDALAGPKLASVLTSLLRRT